MQLRRALMTGLRRSFDFRGHSTRAEYLPFLGTAALALAAALGLAFALVPATAFAPCALGLLALFYIPVTSAGMRRLRDAGQPPELMLNPLKPAVAAMILLGVIWLILRTSTGFTLFYLSSLAVGPLYVVLAVLGVLGVSLLTALYFTDTASRLLLPTSKGPSPLSKVQK